ncbi:acetolactate synthase, large subunit, biosynthetic type [Helicobacter sp. 12S02232-10]|uniref:acetolactate synthase large subunit n=1 Tax=Helicobacter sp. 12S02232-10 TaxID=1476197 RepID=UPI000BA5E912|nr:acetolactate synthase large subunit [Helicobacter sp. 12S02232-10]PAF49415.1 acetolactate synthase, large subunit, biosynthetic type [Helicobacter sp. 12S02232-10]
MPTKRLNGSEMVIEALRSEGVKVIFGYPGGAVLNVYDEIYKQNYFKHILTRHEQGAIHAADGYARASGEVGVAVITSGPGFTNAVTGIATAYTDSIPLVIISGQVPIVQIGTDAFQEIDAVGISRPCTKHNFLVKSIEELPRILKEAFYIAKSGRPGPVLVDLPKDISATYGDFDYPSEVSLRTYKPTTKGNSRQIKKVVQALKEAKKPLFYIGGGAVISGASEAIRKLVDKTHIPALETLMAKGVIPHKHPCLLGMVGMHGTYAANMAMQECDLLICLGARFDDRVTGKVSEFAKFAKIVHIDIDPSSIGKIIDVHFPIVGDLKSVCEDILECLEEYDISSIEQWRELLAKYAHMHPLGYKDSDEVLKPQWVIQKIGEILGEKAVVVTDVGQHQMWTAQFYPFSFPRQLITSGGLGTMGFGLPAAMGVKNAKEDKIALNITGDGSILMNIQELMTCVEEKIPVINVILNNNYLGMVRQWQSFFYESRFSHTDLSLQPDFVKLIEAFGGKGYRVETKEGFEEAFNKALESGVVCMLDVLIDRMEHVLPMVPGGAALNKMILE